MFSLDRQNINFYNTRCIRKRNALNIKMIGTLNNKKQKTGAKNTIKSKIVNLFPDNKNIFAVSLEIGSQLRKSLIHFSCNWKQNYYAVFLIFLILAAFFIRFVHIRSGLPYLHNWDEPQIVSTAIKMLKTGDLNPHFFPYPPLTTYLLLPFFILNYFLLMSNLKLAGLKDITTGADTDWHWTISHPSFYSAGRLMIVILGILTIWLVYEIGKKYFNRKIGLLSALILTFFPFHIGYSFWITPNMTVTLFILLTLFLLSKYLQKKHTVYIVLSGISAGLAIASKYNSFLIAIPLILGILFYSSKKIRDTFIIFAATGFGFFIGCPFVLFDLQTFLAHAGKEVRHYQMGHLGAEGTPGVPQLKFYLKSFQQWTVDTFHLKASWCLPLLGVLLKFILDIKNFLIVFSFPFTYLIYMSQQKVNFLRNMVCMTPFISLAAAIALFYGYKLLVSLSKYVGKQRFIRFKTNQELIFIVFVLLLLVPLKAGKNIKNSYKFLNSYKESRTRAVEYVKDNFPNAKIGISKELMIHGNDLDKIKNKHLFNTENVSAKLIYERGFDYIISGDKYSYFIPKNKEANRNKPALLESKFPRSNIVKSFGRADVRLDIFSAEPKVNIYKVDESFNADDNGNR